jgi:hypothetical protein
MSWPSGDSAASGSSAAASGGFASGSSAAADAGAMPGDQGGRGVTPRMCSVDLPDGSPCPDLAITGSYCERHADVADRDFQVFQAVHDHFRQDLREFWQRSNFYLVVDGVLVSAFATSHVRTLQLILSCAGLIISLFWLLVARGSIAWLALWRAEVRRIDLIVNRFHSFSTIEGRLQRKPWLSPSWLTQWLPACFLAGWVVIFLLVLLRATSV